MFKKYAVAILFCCSPFTPFAQQNINDIDSLYAILSRMPSFKEQIRGKKAAQYDALYASLKKNFNPDISDHDMFRRLSALIIPINDGHIDFSQSVKKAFTREDIINPDFIANYRKSDDYKRSPRSKKNLAVLEKALAKKTNEEIEGIYYNFSNEIKIGIYKTAVKGQLEGVVLRSESPIWEPGEIMLYLEEKSDNGYNSWYNNYFTKKFFFCKGERFDNGTLLWSGFKKHPEIKTYVNILNDPPFEFKRIDSTTQYLRLGSFRSNDKNKLAAKTFYNGIKDSLTAPNLIVDLRNNGGGYYSVSSQFLNLIRKYVNPGKVYALINFNTVSNGEQFAIKLKGLQNMQLLGQQTWGRISYGQNYGTKYVLPSGKFEIIPTDLPAEKADLAYEGTGVKPEVMLDPYSDWLEQVKTIIKNK